MRFLYSGHVLLCIPIYTPDYTLKYGREKWVASQQALPHEKFKEEGPNFAQGGEPGLRLGNGEAKLYIYDLWTA